MNVGKWIAAREPATWITLAEVLGLGFALFATGTVLRLVVGLPLLLHLGWTALTSLPLGQVPGPPAGRDERRRNHQLRYRVVAFLNEVQRAEKYVQRAEAARLPQNEVEKNLRLAENRILDIAGEVVDVVGRRGV